MTNNSEMTTADDEVEKGERRAAPLDELPRREELLIEAIRLVRKALNEEETPTRNTIGNLVQLIKLHKEMMIEDEMATEVELVWKEVEEPLFAES